MVQQSNKGMALSDERFSTLSFDSWIAHAHSGTLTDEAIALLAQTLAASGARLASRERSADLASTGGPGSISTIWGPATLVATGSQVAKLGVPGRPAGGIDVLMQINGYRSDLDEIEAEKVLDQCGYVHLLAGPHGNFGANHRAAVANAERYCRVASRLGMRGVCFITDGTSIQQPYLGRGEALIALSLLLDGSEGDWLGQHVKDCEHWCEILAVKGQPSRRAVAQALLDNILAQGGDPDSLQERAAAVASGHRLAVTSTGSGTVEFNPGALRQAIIAARRPDTPGSFDDSAGLILLARPGSKVIHGQPLVSVRCKDAVSPQLLRDVEAAISINQKESDGEAEGSGRVEVVGV